MIIYKKHGKFRELIKELTTISSSLGDAIGCDPKQPIARMAENSISDDGNQASFYCDYPVQYDSCLRYRTASGKLTLTYVFNKKFILVGLPDTAVTLPEYLLERGYTLVTSHEDTWQINGGFMELPKEWSDLSRCYFGCNSGDSPYWDINYLRILLKKAEFMQKNPDRDYYNIRDRVFLVYVIHNLKMKIHQKENE